MKKRVLFLFLPLVLTLHGCAPERPVGHWEPFIGMTPYDAKLARTHLFEAWLSDITSIGIPVGMAAAEREYLNDKALRYFPDKAGEDVWQTPLETSARGALRLSLGHQARARPMTSGIRASASLASVESPSSAAASAPADPMMNAATLAASNGLASRARSAPAAPARRSP